MTVPWSKFGHRPRRPFRFMMAASNGNVFRVPSPLWREFTGHRWIPFTKASDVDVFLICAWTSGWANHRDDGDFRHHRAHYDVTLLLKTHIGEIKQNDRHFANEIFKCIFLNENVWIFILISLSQHWHENLCEAISWSKVDKDLWWLYIIDIFNTFENSIMTLSF